MAEDRPERGAPLTPEERAQQIQAAKERAAAARAARETGGSSSEATTPPPAVAASATEPAAASAAVPAERAPVSAADRAGQIRIAKERAAAARAAREGGAPAPTPVQPAAQVSAASTSEAPATPARAAPLSAADRAAAVEAAKQRAAAARAARDGGEAAAAAPTPAAARPAASPADRAAATAAAHERAAAARAQRSGAAPAGAVAAGPAWRIGPGGARTQVLTARPEPRAQQIATLAPPQKMVLKRRDLLRGGFWAGFAVLLVGGLATFLDFFNPRDITGFGGVVTVPGSVVPKPGDDPLHYIEGKVWLVNLKAGEGVPKEFESFAAPSKNGGLLALYQKCVHLGCTVPWRSDFQFGGVTGWFRCPCHGSTYTKGGVRVFGPAPRSLDTFLITKVGPGGVSVNTGKITLGNSSDPQRTVPPGPYA